MNPRQLIRQPLLADSLLAVLLTVVSLVTLVFQSESEGLGEPDFITAALVLLINLPLALRRRYPLWINLAVGALSGLYGASPYPDLVTPVPLGGVVALYTLVAWGSRRQGVIVGVVTAISVVLVAVMPGTDSSVVDFAFTAGLLASGWVLGDSTRVRRAYTAELEQRAALLAKERDFNAQRAVSAERARIARELHDVIAHHVSMMVVQAEAGPLAVEGDPSRAIKAFDTISGIGRQALIEMRRLLGVLREETVSGAQPASLEPQPGVDQVPILIDQVRSAGLDVSFEITGEPITPAVGVDLSAYRIVQEALTNAMKHVDSARVQVGLHYDPRDLRIEVRSHGRPLRDVPSNGSGHGLVGMRERVQLLGGEFRAGAAPDGDFVVSARLPIGGS